MHYRNLFLQHVLARIDECDTATDVANSVNILVAMRWVAKTWLAVKDTTICKCFRKASILDSTLNVISCDLYNEDPFLAADESMALHGLIDEAMTGCDHCPLEEYVMMSQCDWMLVQILGRKNSLTIPARKIKVKIKMKKTVTTNNQAKNSSHLNKKSRVIKKAILSLEDIQLFLESRGCLQDAMQVGNFMDNLSAVQIATAKQTTLHDFI